MVWVYARGDVGSAANRHHIRPLNEGEVPEFARAMRERIFALCILDGGIRISGLIVIGEGDGCEQ